jgi:peptidoglycan/LPS O-acetylase OafA/YrhL
MTTAAASPGRHATAPSPAVAPPPGNPRFPLFDSLRGLAVLAVLVWHVFVATGALDRRWLGDAISTAGRLGPLLFFAISGFLLYRPWVAAKLSDRPRPHVGRYFRRRGLRILPAYWLALTVLAVYPGLTDVFTGDWWRYYFFLQLYDTHSGVLGIPVTWTLCVEVTFYLALPLWVMAVRRLSVRGEMAAVAALAVFGAVVQIGAGREAIDDLVAQSLPGQATWFALGMGLALVSAHGDRPRRLTRALGSHPELCWAIAFVAWLAQVVLRDQPYGFFGLLFEIQEQQPYPKLIADILLTGLILLLVLAPAVWDAPRAVPQRLLAWRPLAFLGLISYGVYLWHLTIAQLLILPHSRGFSARGLNLVNDIPQGATPICLLLTLAVASAIAWLSYRFVELPFLRRKER